MWYIDREGNRCAAVVLAIDLMHPPPSYCIRLDGADSSRETEGHRLELRALTLTPAGQPGAAIAAAFSSKDLLPIFCFALKRKTASQTACACCDGTLSVHV